MFFSYINTLFHLKEALYGGCEILSQYKEWCDINPLHSFPFFLLILKEKNNIYKEVIIEVNSHWQFGIHSFIQQIFIVHLQLPGYFQLESPETQLILT